MQIPKPVWRDTWNQLKRHDKNTKHALKKRCFGPVLYFERREIECTGQRAKFDHYIISPHDTVNAPPSYVVTV